jgi:hypothetical protein
MRKREYIAMQKQWGQPPRRLDQERENTGRNGPFGEGLQQKSQVPGT